MTTPDNSHTQIQQHIAQAQARWGEKAAQIRAEREASEAMNARISAKLYHELQERMAKTLPAWMLEYIQPYTRIDHDTATEFVDIVLPGCAPLVICYDQIRNAVTGYDVRMPLGLVCDDAWWVQTTRETFDDFDQAIDRAATHGDTYTAMQTEADRRNDAGEQPSPTPQLPEAIDQALTQLAMLSRNERIMQQPGASVDRNHATDCTLALGAVGIAIANELRRLANAVQHSNNLPF